MLASDLAKLEQILPDAGIQPAHPMETSRVLVGLMQLARGGWGESPLLPHDNDLVDVISPRVLRNLLSAVQFRDPATMRHSRRVAELGVGVAQTLGWEGKHLQILEVAALLHDIGKIGVPDNILFKPGALNPDEAELMSLHHSIGYDVLQACHVDKEVLNIVGHARDTLGAGGADGRLMAVPMGSRMLAVSDAYESLRTDQSYRKGRSHEDAIRVLMSKAGTQFDGNIVSALDRWMRECANQAPDFEPESDSGSNDQSAFGCFHSPHAADALQSSTLCHIFSYLYFLESLYDGFYIVDSDLKVVVWNPGIETLLGKSVSEMLYSPWSARELQYADENGIPMAEGQCPLRQVLQTGRAMNIYGQVGTADGQFLNVEIQTVPLLDAQGRLHGVAEILRDRSRVTHKPQDYRDLKLAATRDALTGVANRGELEAQLTLLLAETSRLEWREPFSLIFMDVDHFKQINDNYDHVVGDKVLIEVARLVQRETYSAEIIGRYGGEEFVVLCPETSKEQAVNRANRIRVALSRVKIPDLKGRVVTASFGVTEAVPGDTLESLFRRSDKALYTAKRTGRNRTCSLTAEEMAELNAKPAPVIAPKSVDFVMSAGFAACIPLDMVVHKLGGFVRDEHAKIVSVDSNRAVLTSGTAGFFGGWGSTDCSQPVQLEMLFGQEQLPKEVQGAMSRNGFVQVTAKVTPLGRIHKRDLFDARARRLLKRLCAFFAAELHIN